MAETERSFRCDACTLVFAGKCISQKIGPDKKIRRICHACYMKNDRANWPRHWNR